MTTATTEEGIGTGTHSSRQHISTSAQQQHKSIDVRQLMEINSSSSYYRREKKRTRQQRQRAERKKAEIGNVVSIEGK